MKKTLWIYIMIVLFMGLVSVPVSAATYEGEVVSVDLLKGSLTLAQCGGEQVRYQLAPQAKLYYNNAAATLAMLGPVTAKDYVSGYVETNTQGLITTAHFYYIVREGVIESVSESELVLKELDSGIFDNYQLSGNALLYLNNYPTEVTNLQKGMKALVILDHQNRVKKLAVFHYEYTGFIETLDLTRQVVVVNVGTRLRPDRREFNLGGTLQGLCSSWESLAGVMQAKSLIYGKFLLDPERNTISFAEIRSL